MVTRFVPQTVSGVIIVALLLVGCAADRNVRIAPLFADDPYWVNVSPKLIAKVLVTEGDLKRKYRPIAHIYVDSVDTEKQLSFDRMKAEAAKIGADAVINIKITTQYEGQMINHFSGREMGPLNRHVLDGLAVIYEDE